MVGAFIYVFYRWRSYAPLAAFHPIHSLCFGGPRPRNENTILVMDGSGPNTPCDFIGISLTGASGPGQWRSYFEAGNGSPAHLCIPTKGGEYEIKYFLGQLTPPALTIPVSVTTPPATLDAPTGSQSPSAGSRSKKTIAGQVQQRA
jgi:hypothetical protein